MPDLMIRCPKTQEPMPTGILMNRQSLENSKLANNVSGPCPHCGELHTWNLEDAWLDEEES
jgi:hypothetical protein